MIFVPLPDDAARKEVFKVHTKNVNLDKSVKLDKLVKETKGYSGADIEAVVRKAGILAIKDVVNKKVKKGVVKKKHFDEALEKVKPSVTKNDSTKFWHSDESKGKDMNVA